MYLPNVNSLMKISLGLIFFTILSTALVYAETISVNVDGTTHDLSYSTTGMTVRFFERPKAITLSLVPLLDEEPVAQSQKTPQN